MAGLISYITRRGSEPSVRTPSRSSSFLLADEGDLDEHQDNVQLGKDHLSAARSIVDKFLILCLFDDSLRPVFAETSLTSLKARQVEAVLAALRFGEVSPSTPASLSAHRGLSAEGLSRLQGHLAAAVREHALLAKGRGLEDDVAERIGQCPALPLALLPATESHEAAESAAALTRKGGAETAHKVGALELAPLRVPIKRRRQMFGCVVACGLYPASAALLATLIYLWRRSWPFLSLYLPWALLIDRAPWRGGHQAWNCLRRSWTLRQFAEYFPATLIKANPNADFSGKRPILVGYHPHGILSFGAVCNFGTDVTGWEEKFPGLMPRICTLNVNMKFPFLREVLGRLGFIAASKESITAALRPGNAVVVVVGGAAEALDTKSGEYVLTLVRRSGFFRLALQSGADLVPSFGFGENDIFDTLAQGDSLLGRAQKKLYKLLSFSMPIFFGRGVFTYNMGLLPYRRPLTVVVGEPIRVEKKEDPDKEDIEKLRAAYIEALRRLYGDWRERLEPGRDAPLIIV